MPSSPSSTTTLTPTHDLLCGALAGICARMTVAPLDVIKIRFQVQSETRGLYNYASIPSALRTIISTEGPTALWKGNIPALLMVTPYAAIQLATFYQLQQSAYISLSEPYNSLTMGAIAASTATLFTYPLDLLRTRFAAQTEPKLYRTIPHAVRVIYGSNGVSGFYAGLRPTLVEIVPYISLHFALYEGAKQRVVKYSNTSQLKPVQSMALGAVSGTVSKLVTLPLDNAKKIMQVQAQFANPHNHHTSSYRGIAHVLHSVWRRDGLRGCFRGAAPSLVKAAPNSAITFTVYESAKRYFAS